MAAASVDGVGVWLDVLRAIGARNLISEIAFGTEDLTSRYAPGARQEKKNGVHKTEMKKTA